MIRIVVVTLLLIASQAAADEATRNTFWHLGMNGERHLLKSGENLHLVGSSLVVQLGRGYVGENWYGSVSLDIISGPYEPVQRDAQTLDYLGTGFTVWWGYNAEPVNIRTDKGNYGFSLGLSYADIVGRTVGQRRYTREAQGVAGTEVVDDYVMRITNFSLIPAVFFCWLTEPRPLNNRPENLRTRIEGYLLTIGVATPLMATYQVKYKSTNLPENYDSSKDKAPVPTSQSKHGRLKGYSIVLSFTAMLGV